MKLQKHIGYLFVSLVTIILLVTVAVILLFLWKSDVALSDDIKIAEMTRLQASAKIYYRRTDSFDGVCSDIGLTSDYNCNNTENTFVIDVKLENGNHYCVDSSGFKSETTSYLKGSSSCKK